MSVFGAGMGLVCIAGVLVLALLAIAAYYYNRIVVLSNRIDNAWSQIDVQLKKRSDLVPNLVETVKGYMKHEKDAIKMVTQARENMMKAGNVDEKMKAHGQFSAALKTIFAIAENYPQLRASENFKLLQEQLEGIESKIAYARQFYNDSVLSYNNIISTIPGVWFAGFMGKASRQYFEIEEKEREPVKVSFGA
ncbi:MAG: LemA family protein [Candidatus Micrarchaeota archaeon]|nr:LemA family protein [Candidatus Micrarchaeota archaeon]